MSQPTQTSLNATPVLNASSTKTLGLAAFGGALEYYDFILFVIYAPILSQLFFPVEMSGFWALLNTYGIFAIGYFVRPLGGIVMAHFGDLLGRKRLFMISLMMMALPTLMIGLLPTFSTVGYFATFLLFTMRFFQGIAVGGEIPSAHVFVSEHAQKGSVGFANSLVAVGLTFGVLLGTFVAWVLSLCFTSTQIDAYAWRIPFILGGFLGIISVYLRRYLSETPVFLAMKARKTLHTGIPLKTVFSHHKSGIVLSMSVVPLLVAGVIIILLAPNLMKSEAFNLDKTVVYGLSLAATFLNILGGLCAGRLCDRIGAGKTLMIFSPILGILSFIFYHSIGNVSVPILSLLYLATGFFVGIGAVVPYVVIHAFPPNVRLSGMAFSYNISYALVAGSVAPLLTWANQFSLMSGAYYVILLTTISTLCGVFLIMKPQKICQHR